MGLVQKGKVLKILFALLGLNTFMQSVHIQKRERSGLMAQLTKSKKYIQKNIKIIKNKVIKKGKP